MREVNHFGFFIYFFIYLFFLPHTGLIIVFPKIHNVQINCEKVHENRGNEPFFTAFYCTELMQFTHKTDNKHLIMTSPTQSLSPPTPQVYPSWQRDSSG